MKIDAANVPINPEQPSLGLNIIMQKYFTFPPHNQLFIDFTIILTNSFDLVVQTDNKKYYQFAQFGALNTEISVKFSFIHLNDMDIITILSEQNASQPNSFEWGLKEISIYVEECPATCKYCPDIYGIDTCAQIQPLFPHAGTKFDETNNWKISQTPSGNMQIYLSQQYPLYYQYFIPTPTITSQRTVDIPSNTGTIIQFRLFFYQYKPNSIKIIINNQSYFQNINQVMKFLIFSTNNPTQNINLDNNYYHYIYYISISNYDYNIQIKNIQVEVQFPVSNNFYFSIQGFNIYYKKLESYWLEQIEGCFTMLFNKCVECQEGWYFRSDEQICFPICGDMIIQGQEDCDDGNDEPSDGCFNCKFQCASNCKVCIFGECLQKKELKTEIINIEWDCQRVGYISRRGYYYDIQQDDCQPICGDGIVTMDEDCDDQNDTPFDGCFNCQFSCPTNCLICEYGKCIYCRVGYDLQRDRCQTICGDSYILEQETCDDGNDLQFDGCHYCENSCQLECTICLNAQCYQCIDGWTLEQGRCEQVCGDLKVALFSYEQCDDPLDINCVECLYQCSEDCFKCDAPLSCNLCQANYQLIDGKCKSVCGDMLVNPLYEECDDGNDIPFDGCQYCLLQCSYGCLICEENNVCKECDSTNYFLNSTNSLCQEIPLEIIEQEEEEEEEEIKIEDVQCNDNFILINNQCESLCGNGMLASLYEECDDNNKNSGDGCSSQCKLEESFICLNTEDSFSICSFIILPDFKLKSLSDIKDQTQIIELQFTEKVKMFQDTILEDICKFTITPQTEYEMKIIPITNLTTMLSNPKYQFKILFLQPVQNPIFSISIAKQQIFNIDDIELKILEKDISLGSPFVMSKESKEFVTSVVKMNDAMMYTTIAISGFALLTGTPAMLFNLIDLLQQLSYIRFMQYKFPSHLRQFLESYTKISLKPIFDYFQFDQFLTNLNDGQLPLKPRKTISSNQADPLNSFYIINAKSCYFSLFASFFSYLLCLTISKTSAIKYFNKIIKNKGMKLKNLTKAFQLYHNLQVACIKFRNKYFYSGLFQVYYTIMHQFLFSAFLQFPYYNFTSSLEIFNSVNAILALGFILFIKFQQFKITTGTIKNINDWNFFFDGINKRFWCQIFKPIQMLKITSYIFAIVFLMDYPEAQSFILSAQSSFYVVYLIIFKPIDVGFEYIKLISREVLFISTICSFYVYSYELDDDLMLQLGWMHISLFTSILGSNLILDIGKYIKLAYDNIQIKKLKVERRLNYQYQNNQLHQFIMVEYEQHPKIKK
ncbi:unnamed protein product [Paramecium pentaurelia]|uniref:Uncharacterized protein n=1 Tax=Paramecium pentaurelia TaxID=43138 RepID=A0A8S1Y5G8_9CILI|nr:unnamed protein product [Paramecium pentaurelia]